MTDRESQDPHAVVDVLAIAEPARTGMPEELEILRIRRRDGHLVAIGGETG